LVSIRRGGSRPCLKAAVERFEAFERVKQFQTYFAHCLAGSPELFCVLDCESDTVNRHASLVSHFKFHR
jgi:hypothetical protein